MTSPPCITQRRLASRASCLDPYFPHHAFALGDRKAELKMKEGPFQSCGHCLSFLHSSSKSTSSSGSLHVREKALLAILLSSRKASGTKTSSRASTTTVWTQSASGAQPISMTPPEAGLVLSPATNGASAENGASPKFQTSEANRSRNGSARLGAC